MPEWENYTLTCKAKRNAGTEGFLVVFYAKDQDNFGWVNFGGWANSQHGIEVTVNGYKSHIALKDGSIALDRWYDVKVELREEKIRACLDEELVFDETIPINQYKETFVSSGMDTSSNELIVKTVNASAINKDIQLTIKGIEAFPKAVTMIVLSSPSLDDENSLDNPELIKARESKFEIKSAVLDLNLAPYSVNILRIKT